MPSEKGQIQEIKTTILPQNEWSCRACWNKEKTAETGQMAPRAHGIVVSVPVHLIELNGNQTLVCYVAKCMECGYVRRYGLNPGIYKFNGTKTDCNVHYWPEIRRNYINPDDFIQAILEYGKGPVWLDSRNGLKRAEPEEKWKQVIERWERLINARSRF
jgi:ferredoxin-like protein FixX